MLKQTGLLLLAIAFASLTPSASGFDPKPGKYKGALKVTTFFPNTDVTQAVSQKATARLSPNGQMVIALPNTIDGIEEVGQRAAFIFFNSAQNNGCFVKVLKDNFLAIAEATPSKVAIVRTVTVNTTDAQNAAVSYNVKMELRLTRVAP